MLDRSLCYTDVLTDIRLIHEITELTAELFFNLPVELAVFPSGDENARYMNLRIKSLSDHANNLIDHGEACERKHLWDKRNNDVS
jgi:hypothetical protein